MSLGISFVLAVVFKSLRTISDMREEDVRGRL